MKLKKILLRALLYLILILIAILLVVSFVNSHKRITTGKIDKYMKRVRMPNSFSGADNSYLNYLDKYENIPRPDVIINLNFDNNYKMSNANFFIKDNILYSSDVAELKFNFNVEKEGLYNLYIKYSPLVGDEDVLLENLNKKDIEGYLSKTAEIEREIIINGKIPFNEAEQIKLTRFWQGETDILINDLGDEIRPKQKEVPRFEDHYINDYFNYNAEAYSFYLKKGDNQELIIKSVREGMAIKEIYFANKEEIPTYKNALKMFEKEGYKLYDGNDQIEIQGEKLDLVSSPNIIPLIDQNSSRIKPHYNGRDIKLNIMGHYSWRMPGYWIEYEFNAPQKGLYALSFYAKQDIKTDAFSTREIRINGKVPYKEASYIPFVSSNTFNNYLIGTKEEPYLFPLEKGKNKIRMRVSLASVGDTVEIVQNSINELNRIYLDARVILSDKIDTERTYNIKEQIRDFIPRLEKIKEALLLVVSKYKELMGDKTGRVVVIRSMIMQLEGLIKRPNNLVKQMELFQSNVSSLGTWIMQEKEHPLTVDAFFFHSPKKSPRRIKENFFETIWHETKKLIFSFAPKKDRKKDAIKVWVLGGRDNAQIVRRLIQSSDDKTIKDIRINLELVNPESILGAVTAGKGPDVAIMVPEGTAQDFAYRNTLVSLSDFSGIEEIKTRYHKSAIEPFIYKDKLYALPETQQYPVLFYREDILNNLGLSFNSDKISYEEFERVVNGVQDKKLNLYLETPIKVEIMAQPIQNLNVLNTGLFGSILYQYGGSYYSSDCSSSNVITSEAKEAFSKYTEYFSIRNVPVQANFLNRFRSGEMPIGITTYELYNQLSVFAPEITGKWKIANIPTFLTKDEMKGKKNPYSLTSNSPLASIMLDKIENKEAGYNFLKWWTSDETQLEYGRELEVTVGSAARYPTANINVAKKLPWPAKDLKIIQESRNRAIGIPPVPGGSYMLTRQFRNAFVAVMEGEDAIETLHKYSKYIDREIIRKREEFG